MSKWKRMLALNQMKARMRRAQLFKSFLADDPFDDDEYGL